MLIVKGELSDCSWSNCGWMDSASTLGFTKMAQCVVQQYSLQCCPLKSGNVRYDPPVVIHLRKNYFCAVLFTHRCAKGSTTQGENIADLAGQQAAYRAYRKYIQSSRNGEEEEPLPDLEEFTPNQVDFIVLSLL